VVSVTVSAALAGWLLTVGGAWLKWAESASHEQAQVQVHVLACISNFTNNTTSFGKKQQDTLA